jgi:outer membrane protein assembly factor BamB
MSQGRAIIEPEAPEAEVDSGLRRVVWLSGVFCVLVGAALLVNHYRVEPHDPLTSLALTELKNELRANPGDETLKQEIRRLDLEIRQRHDWHVKFNRMGGWLLAGGLVIFVVAARYVVARRWKPPMPQPRAVESSPGVHRSGGRWAVAISGALAALLFLVLAGTNQTLVPLVPDELARLLARDEVAAEDEVTLEEWLAQWPRFRGPLGDGVAFGTNLPVGWDGASGDGILWKTEVPLPGFNSPVLWNDQLFISGGSSTERAVICYDTSDGRLLWKTAVPPMPVPTTRRLEIQEFTGYAASTVATDGHCVYALFATGELASFDFGGRVVWSKHLGVPDNAYGHASSLHAEPGRLIVQYDQGDPDEQQSRLYALEPSTGRIIWEQPRAVPPSWTSPTVIEMAGRRQVIALGEPWVIGYDLEEGRELWRVECLGTDLAPSPVFGAGLLFVVNPHQSLMAIRPDGEGDVTATHLLWRDEEGAPDITSPVTDGTNVFALGTYGPLTCHDARTGERLGERELDHEFNASPTLVGRRLFLLSTGGVGLVFSADPALEELDRMELGEPVHATPALVGGRIYVRGAEHLFAIGAQQRADGSLTYAR